MNTDNIKLIKLEKENSFTSLIGCIEIIIIIIIIYKFFLIKHFLLLTDNDTSTKIIFHIGYLKSITIILYPI